MRWSEFVALVSGLTGVRQMLAAEERRKEKGKDELTAFDEAWGA